MHLPRKVCRGRLTFGPNLIGALMDGSETVLVYSDYKSPYAFLAKDLIYELEDQFDIHVE